MFGKYQNLFTRKHIPSDWFVPDPGPEKDKTVSLLIPNKYIKEESTHTNVYIPVWGESKVVGKYTHINVISASKHVVLSIDNSKVKLIKSFAIVKVSPHLITSCERNPEIMSILTLPKV